MSLMGPIVSLAGLCHDLGKATCGFQEKLSRCVGGKANSEKDVVRHEVVSGLMLQSVLDSYDLISLDTPERIKSAFNTLVAPHLESFADDVDRLMSQSLSGEQSSMSFENFSEKAGNLLSKCMLESRPIEGSLIWLVITHHKMLNAKVRSESRIEGKGRNKKTVSFDYLDIIIDQKYINRESSSSPRKFLQLTSKLPWNDSAWLDTFVNCVRKIKSVIETYPDILRGYRLSEQNSWSEVLVYQARPSLIFADYLSSVEKKPCTWQNSSYLTYANTVLVEDEVRWADRLDSHLLDVCCRAESIFENQFGFENSLSLPCIKKEDGLPKGLNVNSGVSPESPFYWQDHAASYLQSNIDNKSGFFGVVLSKTGSGKTRGAPLIMSAISERIRLSVLLGRRALVMQTYRSYVSDLIGLSPNDVTMLIGSRCVEAYENEESMGSDAFVGDDIEYEVLSGDSDVELGELGKIYGRSKEIRVLASPISIKTIDHVIRAVSQEKGVDTRLLYILKNTDLILDEIDDYDAKDLVSVGKVIYLSGFYGRRVLVASATTNHEILSALMNSYLLGFSVHRELSGSDVPLNVAFVSSERPYVSLLNSPDFSDAKEKLIEFVSEFTNAMTGSAIQHKVSFTDVGDSNLSDIAEDKINKEVMRLHHEHAEVSPEGIRVSAGFVRFNHVKSAQDYAIHLSQQKVKDTLIKVVCYHSRMMAIDRYVTERHLDSLLNRNDKSLLQHDIVQSLISEASETGVRNVVIVVSTTSIQETGRDHDYDWACTEPISDKSLVQLAGRVWRHRRDKRSSVASVSVFTNTLKGYRKEERAWGYPGIETDSKQHNTRQPAYPVSGCIDSDTTERLSSLGVYCDALPYVLSMSLLNKRIVTEGISARACLDRAKSTSESYLHAMESVRQNDYLSMSSKIGKGLGSVSLSNFINRNDSKLSGYHWRQLPFRGEEKKAAYVYQDCTESLVFKEEKWQAKDAFNQKTPLDVRHESPAEKNDNAFLLKYDTNFEVEVLCGRFGKQGVQSFAEIQMSCSFILPKGGVVFYDRGIGFYF